MNHSNDKCIECYEAGKNDAFEEARHEIKKLLRPHIQETNTFSEVQQETVWYNDGVRDAAALFVPLKG